MWLCAGQQGAPCEATAGLPRSPQHPAYGALYRAVTDAGQKFLAGVTAVAELG
jgi:hypothetical protein